MTNLPISHMTLYKHGVGFFERRGSISGRQVLLTFRVEDMNDVLKSLTIVDWGEGKVLGVEYPTPQTVQERLAGCSVQLSDEHSLWDLIISLRGRQVTLQLDQGEAATGLLVGLDLPPTREPLDTTLVSILVDEGDHVQTYPLGRVQGVTILDEQGVADLRFFLATALSQDTHRTVTIRLSPGEHDLSLSYVAPAPTWRVSYRLVVEESKAFLQGWGIFDNSLEEDLEEISLSLVAGMPISFIYDLYTPFTPERPEIKEKGRVATGPVEFEAAKGMALEMADEVPALMRSTAFSASERPSRRISADDMIDTTEVMVGREDLGELFQYVIQTPVSVGRGQSAMVPIVSVWLKHRKDLLYNGQKQTKNPVATLRLTNASGLTLERGPVTVLEDGNYVGEALLPFTAEGNEIVVPYAVELGVKIQEELGQRKEIHALQFSGAYLRIEQWDIRWREYRLSNSLREPARVLIEHPRRGPYDLFDTVEPRERTSEYLRFEVEVPAGGEERLLVQERRLTSYREELQKQTYKNLGRYLESGLIDRHSHDQLVGLLQLWEQIQELEERLAELNRDREAIYEAQKQIQGNMKALGKTGKEGELRGRYVDELESSEQELKQLADRESDIRSEIERLKSSVQERLAALA